MYLECSKDAYLILIPSLANMDQRVAAVVARIQQC